VPIYYRIRQKIALYEYVLKRKVWQELIHKPLYYL